DLRARIPDRQTHFWGEGGALVRLVVGGAAVRDVLVHAMGLGDQSFCTAVGIDFSGHLAAAGHTAVGLVARTWRALGCGSTQQSGVALFPAGVVSMVMGAEKKGWTGVAAANGHNSGLLRPRPDALGVAQLPRLWKIYSGAGQRRRGTPHGQRSPRRWHLDVVSAPHAQCFRDVEFSALGRDQLYRRPTERGVRVYCCPSGHVCAVEPQALRVLLGWPSQIVGNSGLGAAEELSVPGVLCARLVGSFAGNATPRARRHSIRLAPGGLSSNLLHSFPASSLPASDRAGDANFGGVSDYAS